MITTMVAAMAAPNDYMKNPKGKPKKKTLTATLKPNRKPST